MSHNRSHQNRLARRLMAETGLGYVQALSRVRTAADAGQMPEVLDEAGMTEAIRRLTTAHAATPASEGPLPCIWCGRIIDPRKAAKVGGDDAGEGTVEDPIQPGDQGNVCVRCNYLWGLRGTPRPEDGYSSPTAHLHAIADLLRAEGIEGRVVADGSLLPHVFVESRYSGSPYEYMLRFHSANEQPTATTAEEAPVYGLAVRNVAADSEGVFTDEDLPGAPRLPGSAARAFLDYLGAPITHLSGPVGYWPTVDEPVYIAPEAMLSGPRSSKTVSVSEPDALGISKPLEEFFYAELANEQTMRAEARSRGGDDMDPDGEQFVPETSLGSALDSWQQAPDDVRADFCHLTGSVATPDPVLVQAEAELRALIDTYGSETPLTRFM